MSSESQIDVLSDGEVLGKYRITKRLGEGGMGVVYAAVHERLGRPVAVKVLRRALSRNHEQSSRFQMEAELVTRIGHPNIVQVYDFGRLPDDSLYFVMEMIKGESLNDRIRRKPLSDQEVVQTFGPLLSALRAAHGIGVVHRDLKPDNVMLLAGEGDSFSSIKLLDFGIAKIRGEEAAPAAAATSEPNPAAAVAAVAAGAAAASPSVLAGIDALKTAAGAIMGTPAYMAPEQIKNSSKVDKRADIYAIGIMLYEVLAGRRPFNGGFGELIGQHLFEPPPPLSAMAKENNMPPRQINWPKVEAVVMRMLAKEPDDRYQDCAGLQAALEEAWGQSFSQVQNKTLSSALPLVAPPSKAAVAGGRGKAKIAAAIAAVLVLGGGGVLLSRTLRQPSVQHKQRHARAIARYEAAQKGDAGERRLLMEAIEAGGGRSHLPAVAAALSDEDPTVSRAALSAALAIAQPSDRALAEPLAAQEGQEVGINSSDIAALRLRIGETEAEATLLATLKSPLAKPEARLRAALALAESGRLPGPALRQTMEEMLRAGPIRPMLRRDILVRLVSLNEPETLKQLQAAAAEKAGEARNEALAILAVAQHSGSFDRLYDAAVWVRGAERLLLSEALAEAGDPRTSQLLRPFVKEPEPKVRRRAVAALARMASNGRLPDYIAIFEPLLADSDPKVAMLATVGLFQ